MHYSDDIHRPSETLLRNTDEVLGHERPCRLQCHSHLVSFDFRSTIPHPCRAHSASVRAILQEHAKSYDLAARKVKHALCHHAQAVNQAVTEHAKTVERAIDGHNAATTKALRYQTKQNEATGVNIATSMNQCQKQVQISSAQTIREVRKAALAHKEQQNLLKTPTDARVAKYEWRNAKLGLLNSGLSVTHVVLGTVGILVIQLGAR